MVRLLTAILALLTGVAGWFYLFFSAAAHRLGGIELHRANRWRIRLRRVNGVVMIMLAAMLYSGTYADERAHPRLFILIWMSVTLLVGVILLLVLIDVRFTMVLRERLRRGAADESAHVGGSDRDKC